MNQQAMIGTHAIIGKSQSTTHLDHWVHYIQVEA